MERPGIVITGVGLATSLGLCPEQTWRGVLEARNSVGAMPALESPTPDGKGGFQAPDLPAGFHPDAAREVRYLRWTIAQAMEQAIGGGKTLPYPPRRCGIVVGTTLHGMRAGGQFLRDGDYAHLRDFLAASTLRQAIADTEISGDAMTTCSACSSSLGSIALAVTLLEAGELDLVISGGYDTVSEYAYAGFNSLRLVATGPLRPFASDREGMKLGEGYGIVVLERGADAARRGVAPLARVLGFGESSDAHHLTQPHPRGEGAAAAIASALRRAGIGPDEIDLIAAHATGTPDNDAGEYAALASVFGADLSRVPVVGFKSHVGHTLGGAGAVELILSLLALRDQLIPACANVTANDVTFPGLSLSTVSPRPGKIRATLNTSLGFGGANTCVVLAPPREIKSSAPAIHTNRSRERDVMISGIGVVLPGAIGTDAFVKSLAREPRDGLVPDAAAIPESEYAHLLNARRVRRMNDYVKLTLAATQLACQDAGLSEGAEALHSSSAILGTAHGGSGYCVSYYRQIVNEGMAAANPILFAEGVPNAAAAHLSLMLSLRGSCQTVIGSRTAGLDALRLASLRIASGQCDRVIVSTAEEVVSEINQAYARFGLYDSQPEAIGFGDGNGFRTGCGAVTLVLESREALTSRNGRARARLLNTATRLQRKGGTVCAIRDVIDALGDPVFVVGSANNTWVDRAERAALGRSGRQTTLSSIYGHLPETFSVGPLASIAAVLLSGRLPSFRGEVINASRGIRRATGGETPSSFAVLCTGYSGTVAGVTLAR